MFTFRTYADNGPGNIVLAAAVFDRDGASLLSGIRYSAQFFAGPAGTADDQLVAVGSLVLFAPENLLPEGGYFPSGPVVTVPGVPAGSPARLQMRVWDNEGGIKPDWAHATLRASSASFNLPTLADPKNPKIGVSPGGLKSFQLPAGQQDLAPVRANFVTAYANYLYHNLFGQLIPENSVFRGFSADGRTLLVDHLPMNPPSFKLTPLRLRYQPDGSEVVSEPALPAAIEGVGWTGNGLSADGSVLLATKTSPTVDPSMESSPAPAVRVRSWAGMRTVVIKNSSGIAWC